jgi:ATP phosphoribosyltransferase regulatory subunit
MDAAIAGFAARENEMDKAGVDTSAVSYDAAFGRALDYYTALVYEITTPDGLVLAGGGRYDRLLTMIGAKSAVPGVGFSVWLDRVAALSGDAA